MKTIDAYASHNAKSPLESYPIQRRLVASNDVQIEIDYCGVCHTDLHFVNNDWGMSEYPVVPGHEIVGRVSEVGTDVKQFKVGDVAAIGCMVKSCGECQSFIA